MHLGRNNRRRDGRLCHRRLLRRSFDAFQLPVEDGPAPDVYLRSRETNDSKVFRETQQQQVQSSYFSATEEVFRGVDCVQFRCYRIKGGGKGIWKGEGVDGRTGGDRRDLLTYTLIIIPSQVYFIYAIEQAMPTFHLRFIDLS